MAKTIVVIASAMIFTVLGIITGLVIVLNRPHEFHDPEGFITILMVACPTATGLIAGAGVGLVAATLATPRSKSA